MEYTGSYARARTRQRLRGGLEFATTSDTFVNADENQPLRVPSGKGTKKLNNLVLGIDLGGTNVRQSLFAVESDGALSLVESKNTRSSEWNDAEAPIVSYAESLRSRGMDPLGICAAVAGPGDEFGNYNLTNLGWTLSETSLRTNLGLENVWLINDGEGIGYGAMLACGNDLAEIKPGKQTGDRGIVMFPGTGFNAVLLFPNDPKNPQVYPLEVGHMGLSVKTPQQIAVATYLLSQGIDPSWESVVCGSGLARIYNCFMASLARKNPAELLFAPYTSKPSAWLEEKLTGPLPQEAISEAALKHEDPLCLIALSMYVEYWGYIAANLAFGFKATRGLLIAGGIAPQILPALRKPMFLKAFHDNRLAEMVSNIPVSVITNTDVGIMGAADYARQKCQLFVR